MSKGRSEPEGSAGRAVDSASLQAALRYRELGLAVIPLKSMSKNPDLSKWAQYQKRQPTEKEIRDWFSEGKHNLAVVCGDVSGGLIALDFDDIRAFHYCYPDPSLVNETLVVETGGGGAHLYARVKGGGKPKSGTLKPRTKRARGKPWLPLDIQAEGKYAMAPPSVHPSGKVTRFVGEAERIIEVEEAKLREFLQRRAEEWPLVVQILDDWTPGTRHNLALGFAKFLRFKAGFDEERVEDVVRRLCAAAGDEDVQDRIRAVRDTLAKGPEETAAVEYLGENLYESLVAHVVKAPTKKGKTKEDETLYETFLRLRDGRIAEEILTPEGPLFAVYDPETDSVAMVPELKVEGVTVRPLPLEEKLSFALTLPDGVEEYGTTAKLLQEMEAFGLEVFDPVHERAIFRMCVRGGLVSWILDAIFEWSLEKYASAYPTTGPSESGKGRYLTVCRFLFYRSLFFLKTTRVPSLFRAVDPWQGTLILDEADVRDSMETAEFVQFLNARAVGSVIPRFSTELDTNRYFLSFGNTILALRKSFNDDGFNSRAVPLRAEATPKNEIPLIPPPDWLKRGRVLLRKLLLWRFRHLARIYRGELHIPTRLDLDGVQSFRVREAFLVLKALAEEEPSLVEDMASIAKELDQRLVAERAASAEGLILNVVHGHLADGEYEPIVDGTGYKLERTVVEAPTKKGKTKKGKTKEEESKEGGANGEGLKLRQPLTLRSVAKSLGDAFSPSQIAGYWRGLGQDTKARERYGERFFRGILLVKDPIRLEREFRKFVVRADPVLGLFPTHPLEKFVDPPLDTRNEVEQVAQVAQSRVETVPPVAPVPPAYVPLRGSSQEISAEDLARVKQALMEEEIHEILRVDPRIVPKFLSQRVLENLKDPTFSGRPVPRVALEEVHRIALEMHKARRQARGGG